MRFLILIVSLTTLLANAKSILHIGDSHSAGNFGTHLSKLLKNSERVEQSASYGSCGAIARWYFTGQNTKCGYFQNDYNDESIYESKYPTPSIVKIISEFKADIAIIQLGGNYAGYKDSFIMEDTLKIAELVIDNGMKCYWVGAPDSRVNRERRIEVSRLIKENIGHLCTFIDSASMTKYPVTGGDGIHYWGTEGTATAKKWAENVFDIVINQ